MILLLDIGNTHTHLGLADAKRVRRQGRMSTNCWLRGSAVARLEQFVGDTRLTDAALCSVAPRVNALARQALQRRWHLSVFQLNWRNLPGLAFDYPAPRSIGADRLANALGALHLCGTPVVAIDFGTATTFSVVDRKGRFIGGVIAPGLAAMADYLHDRTALLPKVGLQRVRRAIGKSTTEAIRIALVVGYRGLVRELLAGIRTELGGRRLPVVATGGCARLLAAGLPEITKVEPGLTLEGLRLAWAAARTSGRR